MNPLHKFGDLVSHLMAFWALFSDKEKTRNQTHTEGGVRTYPYPQCDIRKVSAYWKSFLVKLNLWGRFEISKDFRHCTLYRDFLCLSRMPLIFLWFYISGHPHADATSLACWSQPTYRGKITSGAWLPQYMPIVHNTDMHSKHRTRYHVHTAHSDIYNKNTH